MLTVPKINAAGAIPTAELKDSRLGTPNDLANRISRDCYIKI